MIPQDTAGYGRMQQDPKYLLVRTTKTTILPSVGVRWYFILFLSAYFVFETWRFPAQNIIRNCSQCVVSRRTAAGMEPVQVDHATVKFPGCKALPSEAPIA